MKKVWETPKLVGLVRGKPEERVLQVCKGEVPGDPLNVYDACWEEHECDDCREVAAT